MRLISTNNFAINSTMYNVNEIADRTFRPKLRKFDSEQRTPRYAHWKRDGHMLRFEIDIVGTTWDLNGNKWSAWTRRPTDVSWDILECWRGLNSFLKDIQDKSRGKWILLGEMFYPDQPASYIKTGLANGDIALEIEFFCIVQAPDYVLSELIDLPLEETCKYLQKYNIPFVPFHANPTDHTVKELFEYTKQATRDIEGFVFKDGNMSNWQRWKDTNTIDLIVTGITIGEGKYAGQVGSLCVSTTEGYEVASVSGMTDEQREEITQAAMLGTLQGRVCEVEYQLVGSKGRLRHPQFKRWREDKAPEDCTLTQDHDLYTIWKGGK